MPKLDDLLKWPTDENEVTVDAMLRFCGVETQYSHLEKWRGIDNAKDFMASPLYMALTRAVISGVGLMHCLRMLRDVNPEAADKFAREHWVMCDAGDSFGEWLWQFIEEAGIDPELIKLPEPEADPKE